MLEILGQGGSSFVSKVSNEFSLILNPIFLLSLLLTRLLLQISQSLILNNYCYGQMRDLTLKSLKIALTTTFTQFNKNSVAAWVHLIATETENFAYNYLKPKLSLLSDILTLAGILGLLLYVNFSATILIASVLTIYAIVISLLFVPFLRVLGERRLSKMTLRNTYLTHLINNWLENQISPEKPVKKRLNDELKAIKVIGVIQ